MITTTTKRSSLTHLSIAQKSLVLVVGILFGALLAWIFDSSQNKSDTAIELLTAISSLATVGVALWIFFNNWKRENESVHSAVKQKTKLVITYLQPDLFDLYSSYSRFAVSHKKFLQKFQGVGAHIAVRSIECNNLVSAGEALRSYLEVDALRILGDRFEMCFEIDPTVGLALMNLRNILEGHLPGLKDLFPDNIKNELPLRLNTAYFFLGRTADDDSVTELIKVLVIFDEDGFEQWYENKESIRDSMKTSGVFWN